jgi:hypothetical protein
MDDGVKPGTYELRDDGVYRKLLPMDGGGWLHVIVLKPDEQRRTQFAVAKLGVKAQMLMLYMDLAQRLPLTAAYQQEVRSMMLEAEAADIEF